MRLSDVKGYAYLTIIFGTILAVLASSLQAPLVAGIIIYCGGPVVVAIVVLKYFAQEHQRAKDREVRFQERLLRASQVAEDLSRKAEDQAAAAVLMMIPPGSLQKMFLVGLPQRGFARVEVLSELSSGLSDVGCVKADLEYVVRLRLSGRMVASPSIQSFHLKRVGRRLVYASQGGFSDPARRAARALGIELWGPTDLKRVVLPERDSFH